MPKCSITVQNVVDFCRTNNKLTAITNIGGIDPNQPALTFANQVLQEILSPPYAWKFNRVEMPLLVTDANKQDYLFAGATAFVLNTSPNAGGVGIDLASNNAVSESGNTVTVNTLEPHGFGVGDTVYMLGNTVSDYNSLLVASGTKSTWTQGWAITAVPTPTRFQFTHSSSGLAVSGAPGINDLRWLQSATLVDINLSTCPQPTWPIDAVDQIDPTSQVDEPKKVCVVSDNGAGVLKIRISPIQGVYPLGIQMVYQASPPLMNALTSKWTPVTDDLAYVYQQGMLAKVFALSDNARAEIEEQKFQRAIAKALGISDAEQNGYGIYPSQGLFMGD